MKKVRKQQESQEIIKLCIRELLEISNILIAKPELLFYKEHSIEKLELDKVVE